MQGVLMSYICFRSSYLRLTFIKIMHEFFKKHSKEFCFLEGIGEEKRKK